MPEPPTGTTEYQPHLSAFSLFPQNGLSSRIASRDVKVVVKEYAIQSIENGVVVFPTPYLEVFKPQYFRKIAVKQSHDCALGRNQVIK